MASHKAKELVGRHLGSHRSTKQVLSTAAGAPATILSTFEIPVNTGGAPTSSVGQGSNTAANDVTSQVAQLNNGLIQLVAAQEAGIAGLTANTLALGQNTVAKASGGGSALGTIGSVAGDIFGGGLLSPIISGLVSLFGGSGTSTPAPLVKFTLPPIISYEGGQVGGPTGQVVPTDSGQTGQPRAAAQAPASQVQIQVNAMDSKSFLDHSDEIAQAVRKAILNSSSLNDVIANL